MTKPTRSNEPNSENWPSSPKSGTAMILSGSAGTLRFQPLGLTFLPSTDGPTWAIASTTTATTVVIEDRDQDRAAHLADVERHHQHQPEGEHQDRPAVEEAVGPELHRDRGVGGVRDAAHEPGVDQADERDEQADADADRGLQLGRDGVEHRAPEAGEHQDQDHDALEHHQAHRVRPRTCPRRSRRPRRRSARVRWPARAGSWRRRPSGSSSPRRPGPSRRRSAAGSGRAPPPRNLPSASWAKPRMSGLSTMM